MAEVERLMIMHMERDKYRWYHIHATLRDWRNPLDFYLSPGELLELAAYVEQHRPQLEQEAQEDEERNARAWSEDMKDMEQMKREWSEYREG